VTVAIVIVGHGGFPDGLKDAIEMIVGPQERLATISLGPADEPTEVARRIEGALSEMGAEEGSDAVVFADLFGGSPANAAASLLVKRPNLEVLAGVNLPMAIEIMTDRSGSAHELAAKALEAGRDSVMDAGAKIREALKRRGEG
jgi:PTS system mannose-specific IIA component